MQVELAQLRRLIESHRPLLDRIRGEPPDAVGLSALAAMLHSFYNGVENTFKRVATELDGGLPGSEAWHRRLLNGMAGPTSARPAVITAALRDKLCRYLDFRHFFRHAYTFDLRWAKMERLVREVESTLRELDAQLAAFLKAAPSP
jgi:hypothetical protein